MKRAALATIWILLFAMPVRALESDDLGDLETERILRARSVRELEDGVKMKNALGLARATCEFEMRGSGVPISCFETVGREEQERVLSISQAAASRLLLTETCRARVGHTTSIERLDRWKDSRWLTPSCRSAILARASDLQYMEAGRSPEILFRRRFARPAF